MQFLYCIRREEAPEWNVSLPCTQQIFYWHQCLLCTSNQSMASLIHCMERLLFSHLPILASITTLPWTHSEMYYPCPSPFFLSTCWFTRDHIGRSTRNSSPVITSCTDGAKGCSDHRFRAPPAGYTPQLLTLHQHRANNQYRMAYQI